MNARELAKLKNINHTLTLIKSEFPKFEIIQKKDSLFMKILNVLLRIITFNVQKFFMSKYITTIGEKVYVPDSWDEMDERSKIIVLRHERIHMLQKKRYTFLIFSIMYLLIPFPFLVAYCRMRFEKEAYEESIKLQVALYGKNSAKNEKFKESIVKQFTTGAYGWMWIFKSNIEDWFDKTLLKHLH